MNIHSVQILNDATGVYIHVPFCRSKCRYCGFYSELAADHDTNRLVSALVSELDRYRAVGEVHTLYIGGGSPTSLPRQGASTTSDLLVGLVAAVALRWPGREEFTVECNPGQADAKTLSALRELGVSRLSFGVQSFCDEELMLLGRGHSVAQAKRSICEAREVGFDNIGLDLIFAIPGSSLASWEYSLKSAVETGVEHISAYSLSFEPGTAFNTARLAGEIEVVDEDTDRAMYDLAIDYLASNEFVQYEISNFAREGFACVHNQGYWDNRPFIGIGPSAGSYWQGVRSVNVSDIGLYISRIEAGLDAYEQCEYLDDNERICETAVLNLRSRKGVDLVRFRETTGVDFLKVFAEPLERYGNLGLIEVDTEGVRLARGALAVADSVLCDFSSI